MILCPYCHKMAVLADGYGNARNHSALCTSCLAMTKEYFNHDYQAYQAFGDKDKVKFHLGPVIGKTLKPGEPTESQWVDFETWSKFYGEEVAE